MHRTLHLALVFVAALSGSLALAHDSWLEPTVWRPSADSVVGMNLLVGHAGERDVRPRADARIERFFATKPAIDGAERASADVPGAEGRAPAGYLRTGPAGLYVVGYRSRDSFLELEAAKFEAYLVEEGLEHALEERARRDERAEPGREAYSRCAKCMVVVGEGPSVGFDAPIGLTLELVPLDDPFALAPGAKLRIRALYAEKPLAGLLLEAERVDDESGTKHQARTDAEGIATFTLPESAPQTWSGRWLIAGVHMTRAAPDLDHDWQSLWAALTFEVPSPAPSGPSPAGGDDEPEAP